MEDEIIEETSTLEEGYAEAVEYLHEHGFYEESYWE